jgi:4'-phosphopantetheinyl transferase
MQKPEAEIWLVALDAAAPAIAEALQGRVRSSGTDAETHVGSASQTAGHHGELARIALRLLLSAHIGWERARAPFAREAGGKPYLANAPQFSLTHSDGYALIALSTSSPVGVDLEPVRSVRIADNRRARIERIAETVARGAALPAQPADARFAQAWVRLEALAKVTGEGIGSILTRYGARPGHDSLLPVEEDNSTGFAVHDLDIGTTHVAAIAHRPTIGAQAVCRFPTDAESLATLLDARLR